MSVHDWTRVDAGIFHAFHHGWIEEISRALNRGILPANYYALPEQHAAGFGPDVLTLQGSHDESGDTEPQAHGNGSTGLLVAPPRIDLTAETEMEFYRRKQNTIAVRHVSGDQIVAMVEIVSPGNKSSRHGLRSFAEKAAKLLDERVHLLIIDVLPPGRRDPQGIHAAIWDEIAAEEYALPAGKPLTLVASETALAVRVFAKHVAVGEALPEMPLFLQANGCVQVPLEATYQSAFAAMPQRWRRVLEAPN